MSDLDTAIEYYKDLILYQYINSPKATETIKLLARQAMVDLLPIEVNNAFDIDTAVGPQLDVLGEYIGFDRVIQSTVARDYLTFQDQGNITTTIYGLTDYNNSSLNVLATFFNYITALGISSSLDDDEYRLLLKLKLHTNVSQNSLSEIAVILHDYFDSDIVLFDQFNMTISYFVKESISRIIEIAYDENLLPKPMGVEIIGVFVIDDPSKVWSLRSQPRNNLAIGGFLDYNDSVREIQEYAVLTGDPYSIGAIGSCIGSVITTNTDIESFLCIDFYLKQGAYPTGDIIAEVWALDGSDVPTGSALTSSTAVAASTVGVSAGWIRFVFSALYNLSPSTKYGITLRNTVADSFEWYSQSGGIGHDFIYKVGTAGSWANVDATPTIWTAILINEYESDKIFLNYEDKL